MSVAILLDADCHKRKLDHNDRVIPKTFVDVERFTMSFDETLVD
jgi:hypothetical protein